MAGQRITTVTEQGPWRCRYLHADLIESCRLETGQQGDVIAYEEYHPFGTSAYQATDATLGAPARRYRYAGKERDEESGLCYFGARLNFSQAVCVPAGYDGRHARPYPNIGRAAGSLA